MERHRPTDTPPTGRRPTSPPDWPPPPRQPARGDVRQRYDDVTDDDDSDDAAADAPIDFSLKGPRLQKNATGNGGTMTSSLPAAYRMKSPTPTTPGESTSARLHASAGGRTTTAVAGSSAAAAALPVLSAQYTVDPLLYARLGIPLMAQSAAAGTPSPSAGRNLHSDALVAAQFQLMVAGARQQRDTLLQMMAVTSAAATPTANNGNGSGNHQRRSTTAAYNNNYNGNNGHNNVAAVSGPLAPLDVVVTADQAMSAATSGRNKRARTSTPSSATDGEDGAGDSRSASYWERRKKNNEAAKKSRDARRAKESETAERARQLEAENAELRVELMRTHQEIDRLNALLFAPRPQRQQQQQQCQPPLISTQAGGDASTAPRGGTGGDS